MSTAIRAAGPVDGSRVSALATTSGLCTARAPGGHCPRCSKRVTTTSPAKQSRLDAQADAFLASPEGRALMSKHTEEESK